MMRQYVDFAHIPVHQIDMHVRLEGWAQWVRPNKPVWKMQPMWRYFRSGWRQWYVPDLHVPISTLEASETEKAISQLPENERNALRWYYVYRTHPARMARELGATQMALAEYVIRGRTMLINRLARHENAATIPALSAP